MNSSDFVGLLSGVLGGGLQMIGSAELGGSIQEAGVYLAQALGSLGT